MILSHQITNHELVDYHTNRHIQNKAHSESYEKELHYQEYHDDKKETTQRYRDRTREMLNNYIRVNDIIHNNLDSQNILKELDDIKAYNEKIEAIATYKQNQEGIKVAFS
jgi:hypothetical protein